MGEIRHQYHAENMTAKAIRYSDALKVNGAQGVPAALLALELSGAYGAVLADQAWAEIAKGMPPRESVNGPVPEDPPGTDTRPIIVALCRYDTVLDPTVRGPESVEDAFAGLPD